MAVLFYNKKISKAQWRALILLVIGCILVVSPTFNQCVCEDVGMTNRRALVEEPSLQNDATSVLVLLGNSVRISMRAVVSGLACTQAVAGRRELAEGATASAADAESNNVMQSVMGIGKLYIIYVCVCVCVYMDCVWMCGCGCLPMDILCFYHNHIV